MTIIQKTQATNKMKMFLLIRVERKYRRLKDSGLKLKIISPKRAMCQFKRRTILRKMNSIRVDLEIIRSHSINSSSKRRLINFDFIENVFYFHKRLIDVIIIVVQ